MFLITYWQDAIVMACALIFGYFFATVIMSEMEVGVRPRDCDFFAVIVVFFILIAGRFGCSLMEPYLEKRHAAARAALNETWRVKLEQFGHTREVERYDGVKKVELITGDHLERDCGGVKEKYGGVAITAIKDGEFRYLTACYFYPETYNLQIFKVIESSGGSNDKER